ncbi:MAG TPA: pilin [bacterium]|nr:pilin [bacterium]
MSKNLFKQFLSSLFLVAVLVLPFFVFAQGGVQSDVGVLDTLQSVGTSGGYAEADSGSLASTLGIIVNVILSLLGIIFVVLMIVGGFQWMTAGGNEEAVKKAQSRIKNAIIGLVVVVSAYAIWNLIDRLFITRIQ